MLAFPRRGTPSVEPARPQPHTSGKDGRMNESAELRGDCTRCAALCCVALPFGRSRDFAAAKPAGRPCLNLAQGPQDYRCTIHSDLRSTGWVGCTVFDCFGAGQLVTEAFEGRTWRTDPHVAPAMFGAFEGMRRVQEIRYYLHSLRDEPLSPAVRADVTALTERATALAVLRHGDASVETGPAPEDIEDLHAAVAPVLREASQALRADDRSTRSPGASPSARPSGSRGTKRAGGPSRDRRIRAGADLIGARLGGLDLAAADLRGALLVAADLRRANLTRADLLGADLRDAQLGGADLRGALFVTPPQLAAAQGDGSTRLPAGLDRPAHWPTA